MTPEPPEWYWLASRPEKEKKVKTLRQIFTTEGLTTRQKVACVVITTNTKLLGYLAEWGNMTINITVPHKPADQ